MDAGNPQDPLDPRDDDDRGTPIVLILGIAVVLLVGILGVVFFAGGGGGDGDGGPGGGGDGSGGAAGDAADGPVVVEVRVVAGDRLPLLIDDMTAARHDADAVTVQTLPGEDGPVPHLDLPAAVFDAVGAEDADGSVVLSGVVDRDAVDAVVLHTITWDGEGRWGRETTATLAADLPAPPAHGAPAELRLAVDDDIARLGGLLPWPDDLAWRLDDDGRLRVTADGTEHVLAAGEEFTVTADAEVDISLETWVDIPVDGEGEPPPDPLATETTDLGTVPFTCRITIVFHGRLPLAEEE